MTDWPHRPARPRARASRVRSLSTRGGCAGTDPLSSRPLTRGDPQRAQLGCAVSERAAFGFANPAAAPQSPLAGAWGYGVRRLRCLCLAPRPAVKAHCALLNRPAHAGSPQQLDGDRGCAECGWRGIHALRIAHSLFPRKTAEAKAVSDDEAPRAELITTSPEGGRTPTSSQAQPAPPAPPGPALRLQSAPVGATGLSASPPPGSASGALTNVTFPDLEQEALREMRELSAQVGERLRGSPGAVNHSRTHTLASQDAAASATGGEENSSSQASEARSLASRALRHQDSILSAASVSSSVSKRLSAELSGAEARPVSSADASPVQSPSAAGGRRGSLGGSPPLSATASPNPQSQPAPVSIASDPQPAAPAAPPQAPPSPSPTSGAAERVPSLTSSTGSNAPGGPGAADMTIVLSPPQVNPPQAPASDAGTGAAAPPGSAPAAAPVSTPVAPALAPSHPPRREPRGPALPQITEEERPPEMLARPEARELRRWWADFREKLTPGAPVPPPVPQDSQASPPPKRAASLEDIVRSANAGAPQAEDVR